MSVGEAPERFGCGNAVTSREALRREVVDVLRLDGSSLACLVLDKVEFLGPPYPQLPPDFRATQNPKDYPKGSLPQIESLFPRG